MPDAFFFARLTVWSGKQGLHFSGILKKIPPSPFAQFIFVDVSLFLLNLLFPSMKFLRMQPMLLRVYPLWR